MDKKVLVLIAILSLLFVSCTNYEYVPEKNENEIVSDITGVVVEPITQELVDETNFTNKTEEKKENLEVIAFEGDLVDLNPYVFDPDGDDITIGYTAPFDKKGKWQTKKGDAGLYSVIVTATDNKNSFVTKQMIIRVIIKNKKPVINIPDTLEFKEGDLIKLSPEITDEDDKEINVRYSGWMSSNIYQTTYEDAGTYEVTIKAEDGKEPTEKTIKITVKDVNREPEIELEQEKYTITEEETLVVKASAKDPDNDKVELKFGKPLSESGRWETKKGDAGKYIVKVTANDGFNEVKKEVEVNVLKKNEPPVIKSVSVSPDYVVLKEPGDEVLVKIKVEASDPENDELVITFSGDMESEKRLIKYGEKGGMKKVLVTVSDGKESVSKEVTFEVNNWPCFDCEYLKK